MTVPTTPGQPTPADPPGGTDDPEPDGPRADCTADTAGGLTFDVHIRGRQQEEWDGALLLHRRRGTSADDAVRLPLFPSSQGRLRAALPSTMRLAEGRWDACLALGEAEPQPLLAGGRELDPLIGRVPSAHRTWLGVRIPYVATRGRLAVRSWQRWPHAEVAELRVTDSGVTVRGRLFGAVLGSTARLEARPRRSRIARPVTAPVTAGQAEPAGYGRGFTAHLGWDALTVPGVWDLWLVPADGAEPARIGHLLDDIPDKQRVVTYSARRTGDRTVRPYYTLDNDLSVRLELPGGRPPRGRRDSPRT